MDALRFAAIGRATALYILAAGGSALAADRTTLGGDYAINGALPGIRDE